MSNIKCTWCLLKQWVCFDLITLSGILGTDACFSIPLGLLIQSYNHGNLLNIYGYLKLLMTKTSYLKCYDMKNRQKIISFILENASCWSKIDSVLHLSWSYILCDYSLNNLKWAIAVSETSYICYEHHLSLSETGWEFVTLYLSHSRVFDCCYVWSV